MTGGGQLDQAFSVNLAQTYDVSARIRLDAMSGVRTSGGIRLVAYAVPQGGGAWVELGSSPVYTTINGWQWTIFSFTSSVSGGSVVIRWERNSNAGWSVDASLDAVIITPSAGCPGCRRP